MDKFKPGEDSFCTEDGRAQNRIPNELSKIPIQNGTVLNAKMLNAWNEELVNLIESLGITPDSTQNNQIATGLDLTTIYNKVGQIKSWLCSSENIPKTEAVLDGSILKPEDYEDGLAELKKRCPVSWKSGENIQLPNYNNYFARFDSSRTLGDTQSDAMRKITFDVESELTPPKSLEIEIPGRVERADYNKKGHTGYNKIHNLGIPTAITPYSDTSDIAQKPNKTVTLPSNFKVEIRKRVSQEGTVASENRPKNFGVLMTIVVGIPKTGGHHNGQI